MLLIKAYWVLMNILLSVKVFNELKQILSESLKQSSSKKIDFNDFKQIYFECFEMICIFLFLINYLLLMKNQKLERINSLKKVYQIRNCVICFMKKSCIIFRPCNHLCSCAGCYIALLKYRKNSCPVCQQKTDP
jgi:hypothetical protein